MTEEIDHEAEALSYLDTVRTKTDGEALQKAQVHALLAIAAKLPVPIEVDSNIIDRFPKVRDLSKENHE